MLLDNHRAKIKSEAELALILGTRPRERSVVLCHGAFDVVHPGHLQHLVYAKSKAEVLVVGITSDRYVQKGEGRPHIPQEYRAASLAMLDIVDYVVIDDDPKPLLLISLLQPDYFAKGFEYSETARGGRTIAETEAVAAYGGEMLFTPGDFVRSSSTLLEMRPPDMRYEKLDLVMRSAKLTFEDLRDVLHSMPSVTVHVVGDTIVDRLIYGDVIGCSTATPTLSVRRTHSVDFIGGAAVVAKHARAAGAEVLLSTVLGDDACGQFVLDDLVLVGVCINSVVDQARPTTLKEVIVAGNHRLLKLDTVDNRTISDDVLEMLTQSVATEHHRGVVFSDFRHGIFNARTISKLVGSIPKGVLRVADSQVASRWGNITEFKEFDLVTPNEREARFALADQDSGIRPLASRLYDVAGCGLLLLKLGERGVLACTSADHESVDSFVVVDSLAEEVRDPVGAGDALLAYATLSLLVSPSPEVATILGSFAAGCACSTDGNVPVRPEYVLDVINQAEEAC